MRLITADGVMLMSYGAPSLRVSFPVASIVGAQGKGGCEQDALLCLHYVLPGKNKTETYPSYSRILASRSLQ